MGKASGKRSIVTVQTGASHCSLFRQQIILLRKKSIVSPTERPENATAFSKLGGKDLRFSMKMMFVPVYGAAVQPV